LFLYFRFSSSFFSLHATFPNHLILFDLINASIFYRGTMRGNEIAHKLARDGSVLWFVGPEPFFGVSRQNIRRKMKCWMENQHLVLWCGPCSTQRQAPELISDPDLATGAQLLSFNRTQSRVVIGLLTGYKTLRRHFYL
jgi:hypothetical protein